MNTADHIDIAQILKDHRKRLGLTQAAMAGRLGIGSKRLGSYEDGRARPKIEDLVMISRKLRYKTIDAFLRKNECSTVESEIENAYYQLPADKREIVDFILYNQK